MPTPSGIPIVNLGQQFPSRKALAKHLAPLLGKSVGALAMALSRYDVEHVIDRQDARRHVPPGVPLG